MATIQIPIHTKAKEKGLARTSYIGNNLLHIY